MGDEEGQAAVKPSCDCRVWSSGATASREFRLGGLK